MFKSDIKKDTYKPIVESNSKLKSLIVLLTSYYFYKKLTRLINNGVNLIISFITYFFVIFPISIVLKMMKYHVDKQIDERKTFWKDY